MKMNSSGKIVWTRKLDNFYEVGQMENESKYYFITLFDNQTMYLIYNENVKEYIEGKSKKVTNKDNLVVVHSVDGDGIVKKEVLKDVKGVLVVPFTMGIDNKSVIVTHGTYKGIVVHDAKCNVLKVVK